MYEQSSASSRHRGSRSHRFSRSRSLSPSAAPMDDDGDVGQASETALPLASGGVVSRTRAAAASGARRMRHVGGGTVSPMTKFKPTLAVVKHGMSPQVVATLRKDFVPRSPGFTDASSPHYALAHPPLPGVDTPAHGGAAGAGAGAGAGSVLPAAAKVQARKVAAGLTPHFPASASFLRSASQDGGPTFGKMNGQRLAAEISRWLVGMGDFKQQYVSQPMHWRPARRG